MFPWILCLWFWRTGFICLHLNRLPFRCLSKTWFPQVKFEAHHGSGGLDLVEHLLLADLDRQQAGVEEAEEAAERLEPGVWQEKTWRQVGRAGGEQLGQAWREQGEDALVGGQALALSRHKEHVGVVGSLLAEGGLEVLAQLRQDLGLTMSWLYKLHASGFAFYWHNQRKLSKLKKVKV